MIHGKEYKTVAERLQDFLEHAQNPRIKTRVKLLEDGSCLAFASIKCDSGSATGHAMEKESSSFINKTSYVEVAETSAVGRALAFLGFAGVEIASADEVVNAMNNQSDKVEEIKVNVPSKCSVCNVDITEVVKDFSIRHYGCTLCRECQGKKK